MPSSTSPLPSASEGPGPQLRRATTLEALFDCPSVAFATSERASPDCLLPEEAPFVARAVPARQAEFATGRLCARAALAALGAPVRPIAAAEDRRPLWPAGVAGSISHTVGYCCATVCWRKDAVSVGIDAQSIGEVTEDVWDTICTPDEAARLKEVPEGSRARLAATIFSAKEAFFKAQYEVTRQWVDFAEISVWAGERDLDLRPMSGKTGLLFDRYRVTSGLLVQGEVIVCGVTIR